MAKAENAEYGLQSSVTRSRDFALRQGEELARTAISARQTGFALKADLYSLLNRASDRALDAGATRDKNGRAVTVVFRQAVNGGASILTGVDRSPCWSRRRQRR